MQNNKVKTKFLHIADLHLDLKRYGAEERTEDFYLALKDVLEKYAVAERVSFVVIAGDFFDKKTTSSVGMTQAVTCLQLLKDANIECLLIDGNHDGKSQDSDSSWLRALCDWNLVKLLEPTFKDGKAEYKEWNKDKKKGGYINLGGIRVYGNNWYGSVGDTIVTNLMESLRDINDPKMFNIMMLHTELDGFVHKNIKGLSIDKMRELRTHIDYLALGHIHKNFVIDDWAHSPGSLEACAVDQYEVVRGAYLVEVNTKTKKFKAELKRDYRQRPIVRLSFEINKESTPEEFETSFFNFLRKELTPHDPQSTDLAPVTEITFTGQLGFKSSLLNLNKIRDKVKKEYRPLLVLIKNKAIPLDFAVEACDNIPRSERERKILVDLVSKDKRFESKSDKFTDLLLEAKKLALFGEDPAKIADLIERNI